MRIKPKLLLVFIGIIFVSFNLRAPITSVGPVIELIQQKYNLNSSMAGFITTLPLLAFAFFSPFVANINHKIGHGLTMFLGLVAILLGELIRSYAGVYGLFIGTLFIGLGIAIGNVLMPSVIKHKFNSSAGGVISIYITTMCIFAALGSGLSIPATNIFNWNTSLALWAIVALITIIIWLPQLQKNREYNSSDDLQAKEIIQSKSIWKSPLAWWVTLYMGTQSLLFYTLIAWIPSILLFKGFNSQFSGVMLLLFQLISLPATLLVPVVAAKLKEQKSIVVAVSLLYFLGVVIFMYAKTTLAVTSSMIFLGLAMGGAISLAIGFITQRTPHSRKAAELSGMSQSAGYLLAASGPMLIGFIHDISNSWRVALFVLLLTICFLTLIGLKAGRDSVTHN